MKMLSSLPSHFGSQGQEVVQLVASVRPRLHHRPIFVNCADRPSTRTASSAVGRRDQGLNLSTIKSMSSSGRSMGVP